MELWIRSQDSEMLYRANEIFLEYKVCEELGIKEYFINVNHEIFGTYKSKERALEVLDEIQNFINRKDELSYVQTTEIIEIQSTKEIENVFQMPQE